MSTDPLTRLQRLYRAAQMHPPEERSAFLEVVCAGDGELRRTLEHLLRSRDGSVSGAKAPAPDMPAPEQHIRFCTAADGVRIAYATTGNGPPLVKVANWLNHLEYDWKSPVWRHWWRALSQHYTLVRYDERGCGLSDWDADDLSLEAWVRDLETVVEAAGLERFPLLGISQGGAVAVTYAVRHPEKVSHLILYGAYARGWDHRKGSTGSEARRALVKLSEIGWGQDNPAFRQVWSNLFIPGASEEQMRWFSDLQRISTSPEMAIRFQEEFGRIDVSDLLDQVEVPTLVLHARGDAVIPFSEGRYLAAGIARAQFVSLDSKNHLLLENEPAWHDFLEKVNGFLGVNGSSVSEQGRRDTGEGAGAEPDTAWWDKLSAVFEQAVALPADEREAFLEQACAGDPILLREVRAYLEADADHGFTSELDEVLKESQASVFGFPTIQEGQTIRHYQIRSKLGGGGMGVVYRAHDVRLDRTVALKFLPPALSHSDVAKQRFIQEARAASALDHPNICTIYDIGETEAGGLFIAMACYDGETLKQKIERGPLPVDEVLDYAVQIGDGLAVAHEAGIVHRDIKPNNVVVTDRGWAKILDFGIAKVADANLTKTGATIGTVAYMSPEQARGEEVDRRADIWALGAVL